MKPFSYVIAICFLIVPSTQRSHDGVLDELLLKPEVKTASGGVLLIDQKILNFIEEKLVQHTQALEYLIRMVQDLHDLHMKLVVHLSEKQSMIQPKLGEKVEVDEPIVRNADVEDNSKKSTLTKTIPKLGDMFKELIRRSGHEEDPLVLVEQTDENIVKKLDTRRFASPLNPERKNPWCVVAMLCVKTNKPACGYDEQLGYSKFDDICHMLDVNCYRGSNYSLTACCHKK